MLRSLMIQDLLADVSLGRHGIASAAAQYLKYRQRVPESHDGAAGLEIEALINITCVLPDTNMMGDPLPDSASRHGGTHEPLS